MNTACGHAFVCSIYDNRCAERLQNLVYCIGNLRRQFLLYLQTVGIRVDHARQFTDPNNTPVR